MDRSNDIEDVLAGGPPRIMDDSGISSSRGQVRFQQHPVGRMMALSGTCGLMAHKLARKRLLAGWPIRHFLGPVKPLPGWPSFGDVPGNGQQADTGRHSPRTANADVHPLGVPSTVGQ
jgi:hypothetical protein